MAFERAELLIAGEEGFMMSTTHTNSLVENKYFEKYGKRTFPMRRVEEV